MLTCSERLHASHVLLPAGVWSLDRMPGRDGRVTRTRDPFPTAMAAIPPHPRSTTSGPVLPSSTVAPKTVQEHGVVAAYRGEELFFNVERECITATARQTKVLRAGGRP